MVIGRPSIVAPGVPETLIPASASVKVLSVMVTGPRPRPGVKKTMPARKAAPGGPGLAVHVLEAVAADGERAGVVAEQHADVDVAEGVVADRAVDVAEIEDQRDVVVVAGNVGPGDGR